MSSFLLTGATGFIGLNLAEFLVERGHQVRCLVRRKLGVEPLQQINCEIVQGHLLDEDALAAAVTGVEHVVHLAGLTAAFTKQQLLETNGNGAASIARACARRESPPVLVQVSSIAASGPVARGDLRREEDPAAPISNYGESKLAGEVGVRRFAGEVPTTIVRPGAVFGPRDVSMLPIFQTIHRVRFHAVPAWRPPPLSLIYVTDLCELIERSAFHGERLPAGTTASSAEKEAAANGSAEVAGQGVYFAVAPEYPDYAEFGRMLRPLLNRPFAPIIPLPGVLPLWVAGANECLARLKGRPDQFNIDKMREARASSWACSHRKGKEQLGFEPLHSLRERLEQTIAWYRQEKWL